MSNRDTQPVNVRLDEALHRAALERCAADDRTLAQLLRVAIRYYLQNTSPVAPVADE